MLDRRAFLRLAGVTAGAAALVGCGFPVRGDDGAAADGSGGALTFTLWASGAELAAFRALAREFEAAEGVAVRLQQVPFDQRVASVDAGLQSGQAPDLFRVTYTDLGAYSTRGALLDLGPHLPEGYADEFRPGLWSAVAQEGRVWGVPHHTDTSAVLVNLDAAGAAGLGPLPAGLEDAWTWEELDVALLRLQAAATDSQFATGVNWQRSGAYRWLNFLGQAGGRLLTEGLDAAAVDSPEGREALGYTQSLFRRGLVPPSTSTKGDYVGDLFAAGRLASVFAGDFVLPELVDVGFDYTATFLPVREAATAELGGSAVVVTAGTPHAEQAVAFLRFLSGEEQMARFCEQATVLPTRAGLSAADLRFAVRPDLMDLFVQQSEAITPEIVRQTTVPAFPELNAALVERLERAFVGGEEPAAVLAALARDVERILAG